MLYILIIIILHQVSRIISVILFIYLDKKKDDRDTKMNVWEGVVEEDASSEDFTTSTPKSTPSSEPATSSKSTPSSEPTTSSKKRWDGSFGKCAMDTL